MALFDKLGDILEKTDLDEKLMTHKGRRVSML